MAINYLYLGILATILILAGCVAQPVDDRNDTIPPSNDTTPPSNDTTPPANDTTPPANDTTPPANDTAPSNDTITSGDTVEIEMTAKQFEFVPAVIEVKKGQTVKLAITSVDVSHGFALPDFGVSEVLAPGETVFIEFTADKVGEYTFFCSIYCGSGHSAMRGKLVVTE